MLKKKTLSLILCVTLILTAMSCFFVGGATARTFEKYQNEVTMTFEGTDKYGLPVGRAYKSPYTTVDEKGFVTITNNGGTPKLFFGNAAKLSDSTYVDGYNDKDWVSANKDNIGTYLDMYLFKIDNTKTYRISLKYNVVSAGSETSVLRLAYSDDPISTADIFAFSDKGAKGSNIETGKNVSGDDKLAKADWKTFTFVLKASDYITAPSYLGFIINGEQKVQIDDIAIDLLTDSVDYNLKTVTHDMENYPVGNISLDNTNNPGLEIVDDETRGHILNYTGNGQSRFGFGDQIVEKNTKYYLSFDANNISKAIAKVEPTVLIGDKDGSGTYRFPIANAAFNNWGMHGCTYYIDGEEVTHANFKYLEGWHTYGVSFDTSNEAFLTAVAAYKSTFWDSKTYLTIGSNNGKVQFDDVSLTGVKDIEITSMPSEKPAVTAYSIRGEQKVEPYVPAGLRFKGSVAADKVEGAEIGFVVAPTPSIYNVEDWYDLTKTVADRETVKYKSGEYYSYNADKDVYEYQLILSGLSTAAGATAYEVPFAAVLYVKSGDTYTYYSLGQTSYGEIGAAYAVQNQTAAAQ